MGFMNCSGTMPFQSEREELICRYAEVMIKRGNGTYDTVSELSLITMLPARVINEFLARNCIIEG